MFDKVSRLEREIRGLKREIQDHEAKLKKKYDWVYQARLNGARDRLDKAKAELVLAKAAKSLKDKKKK